MVTVTFSKRVMVTRVTSVVGGGQLEEEEDRKVVVGSGGGGGGRVWYAGKVSVKADEEVELTGSSCRCSRMWSSLSHICFRCSQEVSNCVEINRERGEREGESDNTLILRVFLNIK